MYNVVDQKLRSKIMTSNKTFYNERSISNLSTNLLLGGSATLLIHPYTSPLSPLAIPFARCARVIINYGHVCALRKRVSTRSDDKSRTLHTSLLQPTAAVRGRFPAAARRSIRGCGEHVARTKSTAAAELGVEFVYFRLDSLFGAESCPCCFCFSCRRALKGETPPRHQGA